jgi:hypothetical protein
MLYEVVREIMNLCSGNQMRDVFIEERECKSPDDEIKKFMVGTQIECTKCNGKNGEVFFDLVTDGLSQRLTFSPIPNSD